MHCHIPEKETVKCDLLRLSCFSGNIKSCPKVLTVKVELSVLYSIDPMTDSPFNF